MTLHDPGLTLVAGFACLVSIALGLRSVHHMENAERWKAIADTWQFEAERMEQERNVARARLASAEEDCS